MAVITEGKSRLDFLLSKVKMERRVKAKRKNEIHANPIVIITVLSILLIFDNS
jgi:hypothetical protein